MPKISDAVLKNQNLMAAGKLRPVDIVEPEPIVESQSPHGPMPSNVVNGLPLRGAFPVSMTLDTDFQNNTQTTRTGQNMRSPLFPSRPVSTVSAQQVKTIVKNVISNTTSVTPTPAVIPVIPSGGGSTGSGLMLQVNGTAIVQPIVDVSSTAPAAPAGTTNVLFASDVLNPTNVSASMPLMVGDSGSGGTSGAVPAPPAGSAAAGEFLNAAGGYSVPPGVGGAANYQTVENSGSALPAQPILNFIGATVANNVGNNSTDVTVNPAKALQAYATQSLSGDIPVSASITANIDSINITLPASGGPWRVFFSYAYYWESTHTPNSNFWVSDGTHLFGGTQEGAGSNPAASSGNTWSGFTPVTYANGALINLAVKAFFNTSATVTQIPNTGTGPNSHLEYSVFSSN